MKISLEHRNQMSLQSFSKSKTRFNSTTTSLADIDSMRRDLIEKQKQIESLTIKTAMYTETIEKIQELIHDIEVATEIPLVTEAQKAKFSYLAPNDVVSFLRKGIKNLVQLHQETSKRFEASFHDKVQAIVEKIDEANKKTFETKKKQELIMNANQKLERDIALHHKERKSLQEISESFNQEIMEQKRRIQDISTEAKDLLQKHKNKIERLNTLTRQQQEENQIIEAKTNAPPTKQHYQKVLEMAESEQEIFHLQAELDHEITEHDLAKQELLHVESEIERAQEIIDKFKVTLNKDSRRAAHKVNDKLRKILAKQRDDFQWMIASQQKKNHELEKQYQDLVEEESMLKPYLQSVEKKLAAQMLKLPSLTTLQHKDKVQVPDKNTKGKITKTHEIEDAEMRQIKKTMMKLRSKRTHVKSSLL